MSELVSFTKQGDIGLITINNPPVNALSPGVPQGILAGLRVASAAAGESDVLLALLTDGRATAGAAAYDRAVDAAAAVARAGVPAIVFDCESGAQRLGLATALAEAMGAAHVHADDLQPGRITAMIRAYGR